MIFLQKISKKSAGKLTEMTVCMARNILKPFFFQSDFLA